MLLARSPHIDIILEVTGTIDYALTVILEAFKNKKHVAVMNAELDGTLGPILKIYADKAGVIYTNVDGDQPGVQMNLYQFVKGIGITPVLCGNIKGLQDPYRTPETQAKFAAKWGQKPHMVTSFADGTKISFEQAIVANATGMHVAKRGMWGPTVPTGTPLKDAISRYPQDEILKNPGLVDYIVGAEPNSGVFVLGTIDNPMQKFYLNLYKVGEGPLYLFYNPYHLCHFEVPTSLARAVLFGDAALAPIGAPQVEVIAIAKRDLKAGESIDGMGGYTVYGKCENSPIARNQNLLPIGLAEGAKLITAVKKDYTIKIEDVKIDDSKMSWKLWIEQYKTFQ
jgi:predicted homoserine dehydrogenase-like protein